VPHIGFCLLLALADPRAVVPLVFDCHSVRTRKFFELHVFENLLQTSLPIGNGRFQFPVAGPEPVRRGGEELATEKRGFWADLGTSCLACGSVLTWLMPEIRMNSLKSLAMSGGPLSEIIRGRTSWCTRSFESR
jgi:hypothetical protein